MEGSVVLEKAIKGCLYSIVALPALFTVYGWIFYPPHTAEGFVFAGLVTVFAVSISVLGICMIKTFGDFT